MLMPSAELGCSVLGGGYGKKNSMKKQSATNSFSSSIFSDTDKIKTQKATTKHTSHDIFHEKVVGKFGTTGTIRKAFRWMDEDNDHRISWEEVQRLLKTFNMNPDDKEMKQLFEAADEDKSNAIDYQEFNRCFGGYLQPSTQVGGSGGGSGVPIPVPKLILKPLNSSRITGRKSSRTAGRSTSRSTSRNTGRVTGRVTGRTSKRALKPLLKRSTIKLNKEALVQGPSSLFKTLQEKMFVAVSNNNNWKSLYKSLRSSDVSRSGSLEQQLFSYHLMEFGVDLTDDELQFLSATMGTVIGPTQQYGMSLTRSQSASIRRGKRRPSVSLNPAKSAHGSGRLRWGNSLRNEVTRSAANTRTRSVKALICRQINYSAFMKAFVLNFISSSNIVRPGSALQKGTIDLSLLA